MRRRRVRCRAARCRSRGNASTSRLSARGTRSMRPKRRGSLKTTRTPRRQVEDDVIVGASFDRADGSVAVPCDCAVRLDAERARHAEMHDQHGAVVEIGEQVLRAPAEAVTVRPVRRLAKPRGKGRRRSRPALLDLARCRAFHDRREPAADGFDFGKFGHPWAAGRFGKARDDSGEQWFPAIVPRPSRSRPRRQAVADPAATAPPSDSARWRPPTSRAGGRRLRQGRRPLRPDERPDVGRAASRCGRTRWSRGSRRRAARPLRVLDVAGGTGDIAFRIAERSQAEIRSPTSTPRCWPSARQACARSASPTRVDFARGERRGTAVCRRIV